MQYVSMVVVGIIVGILARWFYPGQIPMGIIMSAILGIAGSFVGALITRLVNKPAPGSPFHPAGFVMSIIGAMILIFIAHRLGIR